MASADEPRTRASRIALLGHALLLVIGWVGFVWLWLLVARRPWESHGLVLLIAGSAIVAPLLTALWVWHNRRLYRRKGERRAVAFAPTDYPHDWHGRPVHADWAALASSPVVMIEVDAAGRKLYRAHISGHAAERRTAAAQVLR